MLFIVVLLLIVLPFGNSSAPTSLTLKKIPPSICRVDDARGLHLRCPIIRSVGHVKHGHYCQATDVSGQMKTHIVMCLHGNWTNGFTELRRIKRWSFSGALGKFTGPIRDIISGAIGIVGGFVCAFFCRPETVQGPPPNTPPSISWTKPTITTYYAKPRETFAIVSWNPPTASDKEDGSLSPDQLSGHPPNSEFERGQHTITYRVKDKRGLAAFDVYTFSVTVRTCKEVLKYPAHGHISCENYERIAGTTCDYHCFDGYKLSGAGERECQTNEKFSGSPPTCDITTCPNSTNLYPNHGLPMCSRSGYVYNTVCATQCEHGYKVDSAKFPVTTCESSEKWSTDLPPCEDSDPPSILDCPGTQHVYADRGKTTAAISWKVPTVEDNSGENITPTQTKGQPMGSDFKIGIEEIRYTATDSSENQSPACIFFIIVEKQICDPPNILDKYMEIVCPNGFAYGLECELSCRGSYPLIGNDRLSCERNETNPSEVFWDWGTGEKPYCKQNNCPDLSPPHNGALTCDTWMFGRQCMMHCNINYDIPAGAGGQSVGRFTGQFTCSTASGKWSPVETVPGCTVLRNPHFTNLPGEMYYFTGSCNDTETQQKIKENFIAEMQALQNDPGWMGICPNSQDCNVENVQLECGTSRRRRDLHKHRQTRQTENEEILVSFQISIKWETYGNSSMDTFTHLQAKAKSLGSLIEHKTQSGSLDVEGAVFDSTSFHTGMAFIECEPGRYTRYSTLTCASCPLGSTFDEDKGECTECPKGTYRDDDNDVTCTTCPIGTSTPSYGTINSTDCVPICERGHYSLTGVNPCTPCSRFQYGPNEMATQCEPCGPGLMTSASASTDKSECTAYDVVLGGGIVSQTIGTLRDGSGSFTLALWIKFPIAQDASLHFTLSDGTDDTLIDIGRGINVTLHSIQQQNDVMLKTGSWQHVAVVFDSGSNVLKMFTQGTVQFTSHVTSTLGDSDILVSTTGAAVYVSGLLLTTAVMADGDIQTLASTCYHKHNGSLTMDDVRRIDASGIELMSPSICDADDDCQPNPCNGHNCTDGLGVFTCRCNGGFTGEICQIPPDYCKNHQCENGASCNNLQTNYTCSCTPGFRGSFCGYKIVDGGWALWSNWSSCSKSCGGGERIRRRECNNPNPDPDGKQCIGQMDETALCNKEECPICPSIPRAYGTVMECNKTVDMTVCTARCRDGLWFVPGFPPLDEYKCGIETSYKWNGKPPSCSPVHSPAIIETVSTIEYDSNLCNNENGTKTAILQKFQTHIQCALTKTCHVDISVQGCSGRSKRSLDETVKAVVTMQIHLTETGGQTVNTTSQTDISPLFLTILHAVSDLENSTRQLNTSRDLLKIEVDGQVYDVVAVVSRGNVDCSDEQIQLEAFCTDCPVGTYNKDSTVCIPCPYGTYQDTSGSVSCTDCPNGLSTSFIGSSDVSDCSVTVPVEDTISPTESTKSMLGIIVGCTIGAVLVCGVIVGIGLRQYFRRKSRKSKMGSFASMNMVTPRTTKTVY